MTTNTPKNCRTCGNCYEYIPTRTPEGFIGCGHDFEIITAVDPVTGQSTATRPMVATDQGCDEHMTNEEYGEYWAGLDPEDRERAEGFLDALKEQAREDLKREEAERDQQHQAETSADRITRAVLRKFGLKP